MTKGQAYPEAIDGIMILFKEFLPNPRDLIPILDVITKGKGWVNSTPLKF